MEIPKQITLEFDESVQIVLELAGHLNGAHVYEKVTYNYDLERNERTTLTFKMEVITLDDRERRLMLFKNGTSKYQK